MVTNKIAAKAHNFHGLNILITATVSIDAGCRAERRESGAHVKEHKARSRQELCANTSEGE
jgi:hypothetical protein